MSKTIILIMIVAMIAVTEIAWAQSTAQPVYPVILSVTTTGTYSCGTKPVPCSIPIDATHPLPTQAQ